MLWSKEHNGVEYRVVRSENYLFTWANVLTFHHCWEEARVASITLSLQFSQTSQRIKTPKSKSCPKIWFCVGLLLLSWLIFLETKPSLLSHVLTEVISLELSYSAKTVDPFMLDLPTRMWRQRLHSNWPLVFHTPNPFMNPLQTITWCHLWDRHQGWQQLGFPLFCTTSLSSTQEVKVSPAPPHDQERFRKKSLQKFWCNRWSQLGHSA